MLIQTAIDQMTADITALAWVEYYGGVAQTYIDTKETENGGFIQKKYPISCSTNQTNCNNQQRYQELLPDQSKKSVLFWEVQRALSFSSNINDNQRQQLWTGSARLIGWLNTAKLGVNECNAAARAIRSLMPILAMYRSIDITDPTSPLYQCRVSIEAINEVQRDVNIFGKYTMPNNNGWNLYPFDYFAIDCTIKVALPITCAFEFTPSTEIECPTDAPL